MSLVFDAVLFDRSLYNPMFNFLSSLYFLLPAAKRAGKRVGLYNCGVGPIRTRLGAKMLKTVADACDFICVREQGSFEVLRSVGVGADRIQLTADAALNAPASSRAESERILASLGLDAGSEILGINVNKYLDTWAAAPASGPALTKERFLQEMSAGINLACETISAPVLLICTMHKDIELTRELMGRLRLKQPVVMIDNKTYSHYQLKAIFGHLSLLYAMRLHAIILASSAGAAVAGLAYQPKVTYYFEQLGLAEFCSDFTDFSARQIAAFLSKAWEKRGEIKQVIERDIPLLQQKALLAADCVAAFDGSISAGAISQCGNV
jgi:polysaccharide pyruvyl transferase WcaK-like protein